MRIKILNTILVFCLGVAGCNGNTVQKDTLKKSVQRPIPSGDDLEAFVLAGFETYLHTPYLSFDFQCTEDYYQARLGNPATKIIGNMFYSNRDYSSTFSDSCTIINKTGIGYLHVLYKEKTMEFYSPVYLDTTKNPNHQLNIRELIEQTLNLRDTSKKMILNSDSSVRITVANNFLIPYVDFKFNFNDGTIAGIMIARKMRLRSGAIGISECKYTFWNIGFDPPSSGRFNLSPYVVSDEDKKIIGTTKQYTSYRLYVDDTLIKQ